jgi:hypothetical protein
MNAEHETDTPLIPDFPEDHYAAVGKAIFAWNDFEFTVDRAIWRVFSGEQAPIACLTSQYSSVFPRLDALICLIDLFQISSTAANQLKKFKGEISSLNEQRNRIVHDPRFRRGSDNSIGRWERTGKSSLVFEFREETVKELCDFYEVIVAAKLKFLKIWGLVLERLIKHPQLLRARFPRIAMSDLETLDRPIGKEEPPAPQPPSPKTPRCLEPKKRQKKKPV